MNINNIKRKISIVASCLGLVLLSSCNDFLEREPLDKVRPEQYFNTSADLGTYAITYYNFPTHDGWGIGTLTRDNNTDNQVSSNSSDNLYVKGHRRVAEKSPTWNFTNIRGLNYFFEQVLPKYEADAITGNKDDIKHYIGEVYFLRANEYFNKLKAFGDFPIITNTLPDVHEDIVEASKRRPRNEVAHFILSDLDEALDLLKDNVKSKNRITRNAALLLKSRVALYEASFLKYHKGTPRVPGEANWPGKNMDYNSDFSINLDEEVKFFLEEAMSASKELADKTTLTSNSNVLSPTAETGYAGWNPYFDMFSDVDMSKYDEVVLWRAYSGEFLNHAVGVYIRTGGDMGLTKGLVESFLMKNGLPIYAAGSGYQSDVTIDNVKKDRDERLQLFMFGETDLVTFDKVDDPLFYPKILDQIATRDVTGYRLRKCYNYDPVQSPTEGMLSNYGSIVFRAIEAHLNYMEASYMLKGTIDDTAGNYWKQIRNRAGVDPDYMKTISNTDLSREDDWGKYSGSTLVDLTLFNIRRERRNELMGESLRMDDLKRWRALDKVENYIIEGFNLWDKAYDNDKYKETGTNKSKLISDGSQDANVSAESLSKYLRPYQKVNNKNNKVYNGWNWSKANYLEPIGFRDIQLASPSKTDVSTSTVYQNPYWPVVAGPATE